MATTTQGMEDVTAEEIKELTGRRVERRKGRVEFEGSLKEMYRVNLRARCVNRVFLILQKRKAETLKDIYRISREIDYMWIISENQSFAVRATRVGEHPFTSPEIASEVGRAIIESFRDSTGKRLKVNLEEPDVEIYALLVDDDFVLSVNTTGESLHKRGYRKYQHHAPIRPTLASCLLRYSGWKPRNSLLDPMCGSGTIPIEAVLMAKKCMNHRDFLFKKLKIHDKEIFEKEKKIEERGENPKRIVAMEISPKHLEGAIENAERAGVLDFIDFIEGDAKRMEQYLDLSPEFLVVNPPYGIRSSRKRAIRDLYEGFLKSAERISGESLLVVITAAEKEFKESLKKINGEVIEERYVLYGDLPTKVFKIILG